MSKLLAATAIWLVLINCYFHIFNKTSCVNVWLVIQFLQFMLFPIYAHYHFHCKVHYTVQLHSLKLDYLCNNLQSYDLIELSKLDLIVDPTHFPPSFYKVRLVSSSTQSSLYVDDNQDTSWFREKHILFCRIGRHMLTVFAIWLLCVQIKNWRMSSTNWPSLLHEMAPSLKKWPWKSKRTTQSFPSCLAENTSATTSASSPWSNSNVRHRKNIFRLWMHAVPPWFKSTYWHNGHQTVE